MYEIAREGAELEQQTHGYRNRTGRLEASTSAAIHYESEDMVIVELAMRMQYASFVRDLGYTEFDAIAEGVGELIEMELLSLG